MDELNTEQKQCFDAAMEDQNIFISGAGGVGKSFVLRQIIEEFEARGRRYRVAASTGVAALNVGGVTIHSLLGTGIKSTFDEVRSLVGLDAYYRALDRLTRVESIFVDEISMLSGDYVHMMDHWLRQVRSNDEPFGGAQIIFCGDFLQLPPVEKGKPPKYRYAFNSPSWTQAKFKTIDLIRSWRQSDQTFVNALNRVRFGEYSKEVRKVFRPCIGRELVEPTHLVATNKEASDINFQRLQAHPGEAFVSKPLFEMFSKYEDSHERLKQQLIRDSLADAPLRLKLGVPVLLLKNERERKFVNGSRGTVVEVKCYKHGEIEAVFVKLDTGEVVEVEKVEYEKMSADNVPLAKMTHFPMRLGWALTIHKSQGLTLDNVEIDLRNGFAPGQAYVALSRLKSLDGMALTDAIQPSIVKADKDIVAFYDQARIANSE